LFDFALNISVDFCLCFNHAQKVKAFIDIDLLHNLEKGI